MRLTFEHKPALEATVPPWAAIHVRIGSGLRNGDAFGAWQRRQAGIKTSLIQNQSILLESEAGLKIKHLEIRWSEIWAHLEVS